MEVKGIVSPKTLSRVMSQSDRVAWQTAEGLLPITLIADSYALDDTVYILVDGDYEGRWTI